ncbi:MAG TPA: hypothetical protein VFQ40_05610 [Actinomycetota bacterium]|nr:hypothetical protein [Actinomycetota bacterium]
MALNTKRQHPGKRGGRLGVLVGLLGAGLGAGIVLSFAVPGVGQPQSNPELPDPNETLAEAKAAAPYDVKLPASLPAGATIEHVVWDKDEGVVVVDIWFSLPTAGRLHLWQTNTSSPIESIPDGEAVAIGERTWSRVPVDWGVETLLQFSTRFEDGVTVTVDAPIRSLDEQGLIDVAASIS